MVICRSVHGLVVMGCAAGAHGLLHLAFGLLIRLVSAASADSAVLGNFKPNCAIGANELGPVS